MYKTCKILSVLLFTIFSLSINKNLFSGPQTKREQRRINRDRIKGAYQAGVKAGIKKSKYIKKPQHEKKLRFEELKKKHKELYGEKAWDGYNYRTNVSRNPKLPNLLTEIRNDAMTGAAIGSVVISVTTLNPAMGSFYGGIGGAVVGATVRTSINAKEFILDSISRDIEEDEEEIEEPEEQEVEDIEPEEVEESYKEEEREKYAAMDID